MKVDVEIMEILAAYDLTKSLRGAAELTGCSHHTVARRVAARDADLPIANPVNRGRVTDSFMPKLEEWMAASHGKLRADIAHENCSCRKRLCPYLCRCHRGILALPPVSGHGLSGELNFRGL